jgi:RNA polymerase sigma-70 factor (ECF subfamily)
MAETITANEVNAANCPANSAESQFFANWRTAMLATESWLTRIETNWTLVGQAHADRDAQAMPARHDLLERYCGAARRYLLAASRSEADTEELCQEFALRLLRGDFKRAQPERGRFRDYVKTVLINLIHDFHRARATQPGVLPDQLSAPSPETSSLLADEAFISGWRDVLLQRTWAALEASHPALYHVLLAHVRNPEATAREKSQQLGHSVDAPLTANRFRVNLHRARAKFAQLLLTEVAASLAEPTEEAVQQELRALRLLCYCKPRQPLTSKKPAGDDPSHPPLSKPPRNCSAR